MMSGINPKMRSGIRAKASVSYHLKVKRENIVWRNAVFAEYLMFKTEYEKNIWHHLCYKANQICFWKKCSMSRNLTLDASTHTDLNDLTSHVML